MRIVALSLVVIFVAITATDSLCCADGCTRAGLFLTHQEQTGGDCPICQPGAVALAPALLAAGRTIVRAPFLADQSVVQSFLPTIEHPPRPV